MHPYKVALAASTALLASTSLSSAASFTQTETFGHATNWGTSTTTTNFLPTQTIGFAGFGSHTGTLTSISITITDSVNGSVTLENGGSSTTSVHARLLNTLKVLFPTLSTHTITKGTASFTDPALAGGGSVGPHPLSAATTAMYAPGSVTPYETAWDASAGDLGNVVVNSGDGNGTATYTDVGTLKVVATYNYTPTPPPGPPGVPEPASLALLGTGLAGLGLLRRRKKST